MKLSKLFGAAAILGLLLISANAQAVYVDGNTGSSTLVLTLWDQTSGAESSISIDTGLTLDQVLGGTSASGTVAGIGSLNTANTVFNLGAGDTDITGNGNEGYRLLTSVTNGASVPGAMTNQGLRDANSNLNAFIETLVTNPGCAGAAECFAADTSSAFYAGRVAPFPGYGDDFGGQMPFSNTNMLGMLANLVLIEPGTITNPRTGEMEFSDTAGVLITALSLPITASVDALGNWSVTAVPVPAAVWLFLSALASLGVVSRRRQAVAA